jgi:protease-4
MTKFVPALLILSLSCFNHIVVSPFLGGDEQAELVPQVVHGGEQIGCLPRFASAPRMLVIPIQGVIGTGGFLRREGTSVAEIKRILSRAEAEDDLLGIVLLIDSPGGTVNASDQITRMLTEFKSRTKKPIYAHVDGLGASGAYYIASAADEINVAPTSMTGSIGVIMQSMNVRGLLEKVGVEFRTFKTGKRKDMLSPFRDITEEEQQFIQAQLASMHERFVQQVLSGRGNRMQEQVLRETADGSVYTAEQATERGLVDSIAYAEEYLTKLSSKHQGKVIFFSYLPPGKEYNLYNMMHSSRVDWLTALETLRPQGLQVMYLWDGF